jgi:hypothetical protein
LSPQIFVAETTFLPKQKAFTKPMNAQITAITTHKKVDFLKCLHINILKEETTNLLAIRACGISEHDKTGVPKLIRRTDNNLTNGILEFDFIIQGDAGEPKTILEWDISIVYRMDLLPKGIKAVKVNAAQNADIAILPNDDK